MPAQKVFLARVSSFMMKKLLTHYFYGFLLRLGEVDRITILLLMGFVPALLLILSYYSAHSNCA